MPLAFADICILLSRLEDIELHNLPVFNASEKSAGVKEVVESWFRSHRGAINELDKRNAAALLSTLLPERRTDRVYGIQSTGLCRILGRSLSFRANRLKDLEAYKQPDKGDLGICLQRALQSGGPPGRPKVSLEEVDEMLNILAAKCRFSDRTTKLPPSSSEARDTLVGIIFKRLEPVEGKWLVRLLLKDFSPVRVNENLVLQCFHFLLPDLLKFQNSFEAAVGLLKGPLKEFPVDPDTRSRGLHRKRAAELLQPAVGIKAGRPNFLKARSIDNCIDMCAGKRWILERKYDGEYCEIHVDMSLSERPCECITIFSKSGKNSTDDRKALIQTLVDCLHLGKPESKIRRQAIIIGELIIYSDEEHCVLPFEKVRKHVSRSGIFLGTNEDSQPHPHEHLGIVFFDLLLLDDEIVMRRPLEERRHWLREVYSKSSGRAMGAEWKIVDFSDTFRSRNVLIQQFAASIAERREGLILKPCEMPYFSLDHPTDSHINGYIKLKKDYIAGMGDESDFAVVGGSYNSQQALKSGFVNLQWTDFHLGCLVNRIDVLRFDARPRFKIVGTIQAEHCIPKPILLAVNTMARFCAMPYILDQPPVGFDVDLGSLSKMDSIFTDPFVFEVLGSGFEKPSNCSSFMLRHPRVKKLHQDRTWKDCVSFQELQEQAFAARSAPPDSESQETRRLIAKLEAKCKKKIERQRTMTPSAKTTITPVSASGKHASCSTRLCRSSEKRKRSTVKDAATSDLSLDGPTLVDTGSARNRKRQKGPVETPCPTNKKQCIEQQGENPRQLSRRTSKEKASSLKATTALSDITNSASRSQPSNVDVRATDNPGRSKSVLRRPKKSSHLSRSPTTLTSRTSKVEEDRNRKHCANQNCLLSNAVVYPTSCIVSTPYITEDLLQAHNVITIPNLRHWDRDSFAHAPLTETVAESQAYAGMRKIVLVEAKRTQAVRKDIQRILALSSGKWRERVEVYDWRVLEGCTRHRIGVAEAKAWFLGATIFDEARGRTLFVENKSSLLGQGI